MASLAILVLMVIGVWITERRQAREPAGEAPPA